jgi:hypothetical protein
MTMTKRVIEIEPNTTAEELFRLVREANGDVDLRLEDKVIHVYGAVTITETVHGYPVMTKIVERDEQTQAAYDAMMSLRENDDWRLVIDERTGHEVYRHKNWTGKFDVDEFLENAEALRDLIDWEALSESIEESRRLDIERDRDLDRRRG